MMDRNSALKLVESKVGNKNLINHMLAAEFIMRALAEKLD
jgi:predicted hydrolase (HD superfamily)